MLVDGTWPRIVGTTRENPRQSHVTILFHSTLLGNHKTSWMDRSHLQDYLERALILVGECDM